MTERDRLFPPFEMPDDVRKRLVAAGRREDLAQRLLDQRVPAEDIEEWFEHRDTEQVERWLSERERLTLGTVRGRPAMWGDEPQFTELWRNAPEDIGEWEVVVERDPHPFAQFALQENVSIRVIEDRGVLMASLVLSFFNALVDGRRVSVRVLSGQRVRREFRGERLSRVIEGVADTVSSRVNKVQYFYVRAGNIAAERAIESNHPGYLEAYKSHEEKLVGEPCAVTQFPAVPFDADRSGIRKATPDDATRCSSLINRTHRGRDLFRPYTREFLADKLEEWTWGEKPEWWTRVYGWDDYWVLEDAGRIVACAGLWDRGRFTREVWRHKRFDEERTIAVTNVLDFGFAAGNEDSMARLIGFLVGETAALGRDYLVVPLAWLPRVASRLAHLDPVPERRGMNWNVRNPDGSWMVPPDPPLRRPYVDLAYW